MKIKDFTIDNNDKIMREKICTVTTLRAPVHETIMFVNYHLNIGIDHIILFFDDPNDMAIDTLAGYKQVTCIKCDSQHWADLNVKPDITHRMRINARLGLKLAKELSCSWIIHIDSDELIYSEEPLKALLSNVPQNINFARFLPFEAVPAKIEYNRIFEEIDYFKISPVRRQKYLAYLLGCKRAFFKGRYLKGHKLGKSATRISSDISGLLAHAPIANNNKKLVSIILDNVKLLHFYCCGFETWKRKWLRRHTNAPGFALRKNLKYQFENFVKLYKEGDDKKLEKLYRRLYFISQSERYILSNIGLLKQIHLNKELFEHST